MNREYASALTDIAERLGITIHFYSGGVMDDAFQIQFSKAIKKRSRKDAHAVQLDDNQSDDDNDHENDNDDDDNDDNDDDDDDEDDVDMNDPTYLRRKNVFQSDKDVPEECLNFYREMCKQRRNRGQKRTQGKSPRHSQWASTSKLINKKPKMGIKKLRKTLESSDVIRSSEAQKTVGAGILTRAAKRRMEALERERGRDASTPSTTVGVKSSSRTEVAPTRDNSSRPATPANELSRQNERDSIITPKKDTSLRDRATADPDYDLKMKSKSNSGPDAKVTGQTTQCDFQPDTLIIGEKKNHATKKTKI